MNKKQKMKLTVALLVAVMTILAACGGGAEPVASTSSGSSSSSIVATWEGDPIELIVHHHDPQNSTAGKFLDGWAKTITEESNGMLKVTAYHGGVLGTQKDMYDMLSNGTVDIVWGSVSASAGNFPMSEVFTLPMLGFDDTEEATKAFMGLWNDTDYLSQDYANFHVIMLHTASAFTVDFTEPNAKFDSVDVLKGKNLRVVGTWVTKFVTALGASPVTVAAGDTYSAFEKGMLDGAMLDWNLINTYKLYEQCHTFYDTKLMYIPDFMIMNKDKYETLPDEAKALIDKYSGLDAALEMTVGYSEAQEVLEQVIPDNGGSIIEPSDAVLTELTDKATVVWDEWVKTNTEKGLPAQEVLDYVKAAAAK